MPKNALAKAAPTTFPSAVIGSGGVVASSSTTG